MGKRILQQRRGRGTGPYKSPGHRFKGAIQHPKEDGIIVDLINCPGHSAPLIEIAQKDGQRTLAPAPHGIKVADQIQVNTKDLQPGNILQLKDIPEGTSIYNIESHPGDGGKFVRASGAFAKVVGRTANSIIIKLPSRKEKTFHPDCKAAIGAIAGSGRTEKPFLKAGTKYHKMRAKNKLYPSVSGTSMNAVDHPFGGTTSSHKGKPTVAPKHAPPGRKVGKIRPRRTGKRK